MYTAPANIPYESTAAPISAIQATVKRGDGSTAGGGTATTVGTFIFTSWQTQRNGRLVDLKTEYGTGAGKPTALLEPITWTAEVQIDTRTTNSIRVGDFFEVSIDVDAGAASANVIRFLIGSVPQNRPGGEVQTYSLSGMEDRLHSSQYGGS
jgi:hypothetical protein